MIFGAFVVIKYYYNREERRMNFHSINNYNKIMVAVNESFMAANKNGNYYKGQRIMLN